MTKENRNMTLLTEHNEVLGGDLRMLVDQNREIWFVAADVAKLLEYDSAKNLVRGLDPDERGSHNVTITSGASKARKSQEMTIITEAGLYQVIMNAKTDRVKPFKRWVTHEVLPQIRKTGKYGVSANVADDPFEGHTKGMNIIKSWRWVAELQQYLNECFVAFTNK